MRDFPEGLRIRDSAIRPATVLAPMAGVTDTVFRRLIRDQGGCGLMMTEFTSSHGVVATARAGKPTRTINYLKFDPSERPIAAQLFGADPDVMADAARFCEDLGFDMVDINFGCPVKKVVRCNGGSGLLRDLPLVERMLRAVRAAISNPVDHQGPRRVERSRAGSCRAGAAGRGVRRRGAGAASAHPRAGLQRTGRLDADRRASSRR